jgi:hypothetical protein
VAGYRFKSGSSFTGLPYGIHVVINRQGTVSRNNVRDTGKGKRPEPVKKRQHGTVDLLADDVTEMHQQRRIAQGQHAKRGITHSTKIL